MSNGLKSTAGASLGVLALSVAFLAVMVWLSAPDASPVRRPDPIAQPMGKVAPQAEPLPPGPAYGLDPFKAQLHVQSAPSVDQKPPMPPTVALGVDPFKEQLHQQAQQSKAAAVSPFGSLTPEPSHRQR